MAIGYKFCPFCKLKNRVEAIICEHCGRSFISGSDNHPTTEDVKDETKYFDKSLKEKIEHVSKEAPVEGIAIYILDRTQPIEVRLEDEFVIGRLTEPTEEKVVDLTAYNGYDLGVSRRHLLIQRAGKGYHAIDLFSTNGTWVNEVSLMPQHPFPLKSGSQIRLGKLRIFIVFHEEAFKDGKQDQASHDQINEPD
jgi:pSer/pThr/pTyr-binding forkhead associated (FHA) protein